MVVGYFSPLFGSFKQQINFKSLGTHSFYESEARRDRGSVPITVFVTFGLWW